jgi:uncharacterized DUF497 family protein
VELAFEWDPAKDEANEHKHDISFTDAIMVFDDPQHIVDDVTRPEHGEKRAMAIGRVGAFVFAVIYTERHQRRRIISARRARRNERERYRQGAEAR